MSDELYELRINGMSEESAKAFTRAVPDVPELVRYTYDTWPVTWCLDNVEMVNADQAAAKIADLQLRLKNTDTALGLEIDANIDAKIRAEAAEAKLAQIEKKHDKEITEVIKERDQCEAWADKLSHAIGGTGIGEHSNINNPWANALEIAESADAVGELALKCENERLREALHNLVEACAFEVESVFSGEIGDEMDEARAALNPSEQQK